MPTNFTKPTSPALQGGNTLATGLSRCFPFTEGSGQTIHDLSTNAQNLATRVSGSPGAMTWSSDPTYGDFLEFTDINELLGSDPGMQTGTGAQTWAFLINTAADYSAGNFAVIFAYGTLAGGQGILSLCQVQGGQPSTDGSLTYGQGTQNAIDSSFTEVNDGAWHLCVITQDSSGHISYYVDSTTPVSTGNVLGGAGTFNVALNNFFQVGADNGGTMGGFIGNFAALWVWNRLLSSGDLTAFFTDPYQMVRPAISMAVSPTTDTNAQTVVYTVTGTGTSWTSGTTFGISGVTGASITSQSITGQVGTVNVLLDNTHIGTLTFTDSTDSNTATSAVTLAGPGIPASPSCTPGNNQNVLNWSVPPSGGLTATYNVYRGTSPGGESGTALATGISPTTYTDSTAVNGTTYYYKLAAVNATGIGTHSSEVSGTPAAGPSIAVDVSTHVNAASVVYTLTGTSTSWVGGTTFSISGVTGATITSQSVNTGAQTGSVTVLYDNTHTGTLTFADNTDSATVTTAVTLAAPGIPANPTAAPANTAAILGWQLPPSGGAPATYKIYRGTTPGGESGTPIASGVTTLNYTDTGLTNGTTYYYKIAAVNTTGTGTQSSETSATPAVAVAGGGVPLIMST